MTMEKFLRKREIDQVCEDWTNFIEAELQKQNWDEIKGTLFTFRSRSEFVNFSDELEYKIFQFRRRGRWKKKRIRRTRWQKFGADAF